MVSPAAPVAPADPLVGRDTELAFLDDVVASIDGGPRYVVLRGPAGMGKTALWREALRRHRAAGHRVLATRPAEEELAGPMVGVVDMFEDAEPDPGVLAADADRFERGHALLATLRRLAASGPLVLAIDDVQWLDPVSAAALRYGLRRLDGEPVAVLATERAALGDPPDDSTQIDTRASPVDARGVSFCVESSGGSPGAARSVASTATGSASRRRRP